MDSTKRFWTSARFAEAMVALIVFLMGIFCGQLIQASVDEKENRKLENTVGAVRDVSFASVREFDYAKKVVGADDADSVVVIKDRVIMPDTLLTRLPQIPFDRQINE